MVSTLSERWLVGARDTQAEQTLREQLGVSTLTALLLAQRGYTDLATAQEFLNPSLANLHNPELLPDFEAAAAEILGAIGRKELIYVHGDYDVDGVTSAAIITRFLRAVGGNVVVHVPHRLREGYGIHPSAVDSAHEQGAKLFLTCDCGIVAHDQIQRALDYGMRVVVTDHHEPNETLPPAHAVVNPHRADSEYPFTELSGAGVAFKLCAGLTVKMGLPLEGYYRAYADLATLGTVADVMPLLGENRILVSYGLTQLRCTKKVGLVALMNGALKNGAGPVRSSDISFRLAPRLNAAGRLDDAAISLDLLLETDSRKAEQLALRLEELNQERQSEQRLLIESAVAHVVESGLHENPVILVTGENWHHGIIGLVAGKLTERFGRPTLVVTLEPETGVGKGSARSIPGFHLAEAFHRLAPLVKGGGHELAAGFSIQMQDLDAFHAALLDYAANLEGFEPGLRPVELTAEISAAEGDLTAVEEMSIMEPFGAANPEPVFCTRNLRVESVQELSRGEHRKFQFRSEEGLLRTALLWGCGSDLDHIVAGSQVHAAYTIGMDTFQGSKTLRWTIRDLCPA
ncbi:MAG: single-stranded-DNA-specific exonuclease RecJ [Chthonomonas sp.]|nr:single-stranded-DNA-specific exonuclease RecJ [Chthonomonas sp.]